MSKRRAAVPARGVAKRTLDVCITHPADAAALGACLASLAPHLGELEPSGPGLLVVIDGPAAPEMASLLAEFAAAHALPASLMDQPRPLGRARSLNAALAAAAADGHDLLLLDPAVRLGSGSLRELLAVAAAHPRAGFVAPRSTSGLVGALPAPPAGAGGESIGAAALEVVARALPRATAVPLLDAQCLFVRQAVLADAGALCEAFGVTALHEWEWILRAIDSGWLALLANHAAIESPPTPKAGDAAAMLQVHAGSIAALRRLHPGLGDALAWASTSSARLDESLLAGLLPDANGRLRVAVDISHVQAATELDRRRLADALAALARRAADRLQLTVLCDAATYRQLGLDRISGLARRQIATAGSHAIVLEVVGRRRPPTAPGLVGLAPVLVPVFLTDEPVDRLVLRAGWSEHESLRRRLRRVNGFVVPSAEDAGALRAALDLGSDPPIVAHPGSTRLADHGVALDVGPATLVLCIDDAASAASLPPSLLTLAAQPSGLPLVVAGRGERRAKPLRVVDWLHASPALRRQWLSGAAAVVISTHRTAPLSWIGLALAAGKPLVLRESAGNRRQLAHWGLDKGPPPGVHWLQDGGDLSAAVQAAIASGPPTVASDEGPDWDSWADTVLRFALEQAASPDVYRRVQRRLDTVHAALPSTKAAPVEDTTRAKSAPAIEQSPLEALLALDDGEFVAEGYRLFLHREADPAGIDLYRSCLERGISRADVMLSLCMSHEAVSVGRPSVEFDQYLGQHLGRIVNLDGRRFLEQAFSTVLLRNADEQGLNHFSAQLEAGRPKLDILIDLARSDEGRARGARASIITSLLRQHEALTRHRIAAAD